MESNELTAEEKTLLGFVAVNQGYSEESWKNEDTWSKFSATSWHPNRANTNGQVGLNALYSFFSTELRDFLKQHSHEVSLFCSCTIVSAKLLI